MNASASTTHCSTTSADDRDDSGPSSSCDPDNPPEPADPAASARIGAPIQPPAEAVEVQCAADVQRRADLHWLQDRLVAALAQVGLPLHRIAVTIVSDDAMHALNRTHRGVDDPTDVLTFANSTAGEPIDADIIVCADIAARRADEMNHTVERELLLYALHGVLHCAGFDDRTKEGFEAMHAEEDRILSMIGVGPTFVRDESGHDDERADEFVIGDRTID